MNKLILIGNVGKQPEIKGEGDRRVAKFSLATSESWRDKATGEKKTRTEWHNIVVFGGLVKIVEKFVNKGGKVAIVGSVRTRDYEKDGQKRYTTEVHLSGPQASLELLGDARGGGERGTPNAPAEQADGEIPLPAAPLGASDNDDTDIPF